MLKQQEWIVYRSNYPQVHIWTCGFTMKICHSIMQTAIASVTRKTLVRRNLRELMETLLRKGQTGHAMGALAQLEVDANLGKGNGAEQTHNEQ